MKARRLPTCAKFHTVGPHVYMPTRPGSRGTKTSFVPVSVLWSLSVTPLFDQSDGLRRDPLAAAERSETLGRGRLDAYKAMVEAEPAFDVLLHLGEEEMEPGRFRDDGRIDVDDPIAALLDQLGRNLEQVEAGHSLPPRICVRKVLTDVAKRGCAEER